jgi:hypothetical protein
MPPARTEAQLRVGDAALPHPRGVAARAATGAAVVQLEFTLDGRPLGASRDWSRAAALAGPALVACLSALPRGQERLLVALSAAVGRQETVEDGRRVQLRSQDAAYLRFALGRDAASYAYAAYGDEDNRFSELIFEAEAQWLAEIVALGWDWYSFRAYVGEAADAALLRELIECEDPERRRRSELERFTCVAEDWADGTALRISSLRLSVEELSGRLDMAAIQRALDVRQL